MPIEESTQPARGTTRRSFLARSAVGATIAAAGVAAPITGLVPFAGAQSSESSDDLLIDSDYAAFAVPLELAAVQAYEQALSTDLLDSGTTELARQFQTNHQSVATTLSALLSEEASTPRPDADITAQSATAIEAAVDSAAIAAHLASVEETLAATHLSVIPTLRDAITTRTAAQIAAVQSQQAALLGSAGGASLEDLTPTEASTQEALEVKIPEPVEQTTTTTAAADAEGDAEATTTTAASGN